MQLISLFIKPVATDLAVLARRYATYYVEYFPCSLISSNGWSSLAFLTSPSTLTRLMDELSTLLSFIVGIKSNIRCKRQLPVAKQSRS